MPGRQFGRGHRVPFTMRHSGTVLRRPHVGARTPMPPLRSPEHHSSRAPSWLLVAAVGAAVASASALAFESPLVEGDPLFSLIWGTQLANGDLTTFAFGPTPHPLTVGAAAITSVLGSYGSYAATYALFGPLSLGALSAAVFAVARRFVSPLAGVLAVLVLITRPPILGWAATARYDIAFGALVVGALALELSRPRRGIAPLALLAIAGLIRPEAWLMSAAYWYWALRGADRGGRLAGAALVLLAPVLWSGMDLAVTGDPLWSLHVTDDASEQLYGRFTPLENLEEGGRNLVTIAGPITLLLAPIALLRRNPPTIARLRPLLLLLAMTVGVFLALVATGMASSERYLLVPACLIAVLAAIAASPQGLNRNGVAIAAGPALPASRATRADRPSLGLLLGPSLAALDVRRSWPLGARHLYRALSYNRGGATDAAAVRQRRWLYSPLRARAGPRVAQLARVLRSRTRVCECA